MKLASIAEVQLILCKDCASREQNHQACLNVMPSRRQSYAKIVQIERRTTSLLDRYAEMPPILCKHFANECKESFTLNLPSAAKCYAKIHFSPHTAKFLGFF